MKAIEGALAASRSQSKELQSRLVQTEGELQRTVGAYEQQIASLTAKGDSPRSNVATLQKTIDAHEGRIIVLTAEGDAAQRSVATLQQTVGAYKQQVSSLMAERDAAQRNIANSHKTIAGQSEMVRLVEMARTHLQAQLLESESKVNDLEGTVRTLQEQVRKELGFTRVNSPPDKPIAQKKSALRSLLDYDGRAFVRAAYLALLRREPDADGQFYYWGRLRAGAPKLQLLGEISRSAEARRANCRIPGLKTAVRLQRLARTPIAGNVIASLLKLESFGSSQSRLRALQQQAVDTSLSLDRHFDHFEQSLRLLGQVTSPRKKPAEVFIPRWESGLPQSVVTENHQRARGEPASRHPLVFQIEYAATASPASVGLSDDTRELAAGFKRIRIADGPSRAEVVNIDFTTGGNARDFVLFGFSDSEEWGSWTNGKKSAFVVWRPPEDLGTLEISIDANPFRGAFSEMQCLLTSSMGHRAEFLLRDGMYDFRVQEVADGKTDLEMFFGGKFGVECANNVSLSSRTPRFSIIILNFNKPQLSLLSADQCLRLQSRIPSR